MLNTTDEQLVQQLIASAKRNFALESAASGNISAPTVTNPTRRTGGIFTLYSYAISRYSCYSTSPARRAVSGFSCAHACRAVRAYRASPASGYAQPSKPPSGSCTSSTSVLPRLR